jgi:hypothetical protein
VSVAEVDRPGELRATLNALAIFAGAALLLWPAIVNGYPILFTDTHAFLVQASQPRTVWDKPAIYGPFLLALHGRTTLWLPAIAQALLLSHLLWLTVKAFARPSAARHLALCTLLAAGSAAPWFVSLLMPDITAPIAVLCIFLLGFGDRLRRLERYWATAVGTFAVASHLSLLVVAAACLVVAAWRRPLAAATPLLAALGLLLLTNLVGFGIAGISPYGSVFLLARLASDGPVRDVLAADCPHAGSRMCGWVGRLPQNSDDFLWNSQGPVWTTPGGPPALAPEASAIVERTIVREPLAVARAMLANTLRQLVMIRVGDTLRPNGLDQSVVGSLRAYFPPIEKTRFDASLQAHGELEAVAAPFAPVHAALLILGALATPAILVLALRRGDARLAGFAAIVLVALVANAFATGALSGPHDRYQARIAWLLLLPAFLRVSGSKGSALGGVQGQAPLALLPVRSARAPRPRPAPSAPASRNRQAASR